MEITLVLNPAYKHKNGLISINTRLWVSKKGLKIGKEDVKRMTIPWPNISPKLNMLHVLMQPTTKL
jgi:hypothetical protein